jgi:hypothetical protein
MFFKFKFFVEMESVIFATRSLSSKMSLVQRCPNCSKAMNAVFAHEELVFYCDRTSITSQGLCSGFCSLSMYVVGADSILVVSTTLAHPSQRRGSPELGNLPHVEDAGIHI